jgi:hypothetical protein
MSGKNGLLRILAALDGHFHAEDYSPADADRCRDLKRHVGRMRDALTLIETTLREERVPAFS